MHPLVIIYWMYGSFRYHYIENSTKMYPTGPSLLLDKFFYYGNAHAPWTR